MPTYEIEIHTGTPGAGGLSYPGADVHLTLYGTDASSGELALPYRDAGPHTFRRRLADLGAVKRVYVRHDDVGVGPGWFLGRIMIRNMDTNDEWKFPCNRWLARHEDDGQTERTIDAA
jgi:PLAT/LH2 domain-containing protein